MKIWGRLSSINVRKVVLTARLLELRFERIEAGREFGVVGTHAFLAKNPNAMVPLLEEDDGFTLWESNVIVRYLATKHPQGGLVPQDLRARFDAERWMDWQQTTLNPAGRDAFLQLVRVPVAERRPDLVDASVKATEPLMDMLDAQLTRHPFIAGDTLSMADIPIACELHRWRGLPLPPRPRPHLDRWWAHIHALPAARGVLDIPLS